MGTSSAAFTAAALFCLASVSTGCVERLLQVRSEPPGAFVYVNGAAAGVTPLDHPFSFYGTVSVVLHKEGYRSERTQRTLDPPWYELFPLDLAADVLLPWRLEDHHVVELSMEKLPPEIDEAAQQAMKERAEEARRRAGMKPGGGTGTGAGAGAGAGAGEKMERATH